MPEVSADMVMDILNGPSPTETAPGGDTPSAAPTAPSSEAPEVSAPVETPPPAEPAPVEKPVVAEEKPPEEEFPDEVGPPRVTADDKGQKEWHYKESRARNLLAGYKQAQEYRQFAADPEQARQHAEISLDYQLMHRDFASGEPERVERFLDHWSKQAPGSMTILAQRLVDKGREGNEPVYDAISDAVLGDLIQYFTNQWASAPDKESDDAKKFGFVAEMLNWFRTDQAQPVSQLSRPETRPDPRAAELDRREAEFQKRTHAQRTEAQNTWRGATNSEIRRGVEAALEKALEPIQNLKEQSPLAYRGAMEELRQAVNTAVAEDSFFNNQFNLRYGEALRQMTSKDRTDLVAMFLRRAERAIAGARSGLISRASAVFVQAAKENTARAEAAQARTEVSSGGRVASPSLEPPAYAEAKKKGDVVGAVKALIGD